MSSASPAPAQWTTIADHLRMPFDSTNQVFLQYAGDQGSQIKQADTVLLIYPLEWPRSPASTPTRPSTAATPPTGRPRTPPHPLPWTSAAQTQISSVAIHWTNNLPSSNGVETSPDGSTWSPAPRTSADGTFRKPVSARYVRVDMTRASGSGTTGIRELVVD